MTGALDGLLVADFSRILAGPLATMYLGDFGADVIKVERRGVGDDSRRWGPPFLGGDAVYFHTVNRNKRSIELDLSDPIDLEWARALAARADVIVENFKVGTMQSFGLDYASVCMVNPGAIYCSISGFGAGTDLVGYDFLVQAVGGLMSITGPAEGPASKAGFPVVDVLTGMHALSGILVALHTRERTGRGQHVEVNLLSSLLASMLNQVAVYFVTGERPCALGNAHPQIAPYETIDVGGAALAIAVGNDRQFGSLLRVFGRPELATDPRFVANRDRIVNRAELLAELERLAQGWDVNELAARLDAADVPAGPVNDIGAALELADRVGLRPRVDLRRADAPHADPPGAARLDLDGAQAERDPGISPQLANPIGLSVTPPQYYLAPPPLGHDSAAVLAWLERTAPRSAGRIAELPDATLGPVGANSAHAIDTSGTATLASSHSNTGSDLLCKGAGLIDTHSPAPRLSDDGQPDSGGEP